MSYFVNEVIENIWKDRYRKNGESLNDNFRRVAKLAAKTPQQEEEFYEMLSEGRAFPGGRTMSNAGIGSSLTLNNCFISPPLIDDLGDIFKKVALAAKTHQKGGGIGFDFSTLRPAGTPTSNDAVASGPVSFMDVFNAQTATILQGNRRGANMSVMSIYHPDIAEFITAKSKSADRLCHFNLSVMVDDAFLSAVKRNEEIALHFPVYDEQGRILRNPKDWRISKKTSARELWNLLTRNAYDNGEPGVFFYDNLQKDNPLWYTETITHSNPCSEYLSGRVYGENVNPQDYGGACNLGSIMLHKFVDNPFTAKAHVNYTELQKTVATMVTMLDNIIDVNHFPDPIYERYQKEFRTIGLGVTGLADMLVMLNLKYNTPEARNFVDGLMDYISAAAYLQSIELAERYSPFDRIDFDKHVSCGYLTKKKGEHWKTIREKISQHGIRNAKILSVAPCGTMSIVFGNNCSSGIEPIFCLEYDRKIKFGGQDEENARIVKMQDYAYGEWLKVKDDPETVVKEDAFVTALNISVEDHVRMLGVIAKNVDMSVSKTINIPEDYSFEDTQNVYMMAHDLGIKGCTIFRPNALRPGILITESKEKKPEPQTLPRGFIMDASDNLIGKKRKITTGCGSAHILAFFDPETGDLMETYVGKGSTGGCASSLTGLSRMISLSARAGCSIDSIVDQLMSCPTCPSYSVRRATKHDTAPGNCCPTAIGEALMSMWREMQSEITDDEESKPETKAVSQKETQEFHEENTKDKCPECGAVLTFIGGCCTCAQCGYSKCG